MTNDSRHEIKFFISTRDVPLMAERLETVMFRDRHADENGNYFVRSLYFDDIFDTALNEKLAGVNERDKYRIRIYGLDDSSLFIERKRKRGDLISKDQVKITARLARQLMDGDPSGLDKSEIPLLRDMFVEMRTKVLRPRVLVDYEREAFVFPAERLRITIDKNVRSSLSDIRLFDSDVATAPVFDPMRTVLEIKYDRFLPEFVAPLISPFPAERCAISKYTACREIAR